MGYVLEEAGSDAKRLLRFADRIEQALEREFASCQHAVHDVACLVEGHSPQRQRRLAQQCRRNLPLRVLTHGLPDELGQLLDVGRSGVDEEYVVPERGRQVEIRRQDDEVSVRHVPQPVVGVPQQAGYRGGAHERGEVLEHVKTRFRLRENPVERDRGVARVAP